MHISDALISPEVGIVLWGVSIATAAVAIKKIDLSENTEQLPLVGVMGAFTFAAQMINFTIPGTGASGHLGGGLLLAILLGPHLGYLTMMSLLLIQALFFGDGGLIAYGANAFNMGVLACYFVYPYIYVPLRRRLKGATIASAIIGLGLGATAVVIETTLSGVSALPFTWFLAVMVPIHLAIGLVEGGITLAVTNYLARFIPDRFEAMTEAAAKAYQPKRAIRVMSIATLLVAGGLSFYASSNPDGLEWSVLNVAKYLPEEASHPAGQAIQNVMSIFSDYQVSGILNERLSIGTAGVIGSVMTLLLIVLILKSTERLRQK